MTPAIDSLYQMLDGFVAASSGVPAVRRVRCHVCGGSGSCETGIDGYFNVGAATRCLQCFGTGYVDVEVKS